MRSTEIVVHTSRREQHGERGITYTLDDTLMHIIMYTNALCGQNSPQNDRVKLNRHFATIMKLREFLKRCMVKYYLVTGSRFRQVEHDEW